MGRTRSKEHGNVTPQESERTIIRLWDEGKGSKFIAQHMGISEASVLNVISFSCVNRKDLWQPPAIEATIRLAARIRAVHPERAGAA